MKLISILILTMIYPLISSQATAEPVMGSPTAPVTLVKYGSLTCGHCVRFYRDVIPHLKQRYIDTGRVRFIFRDYPTSAEAIRGAVAARCVGAEAYYTTLRTLFLSVGEWSRASDVDAALQREVAELGLSTAEFRECVKGPAAQAAVVQSRRQALHEFGVLGTPTFLINGQIVRGTRTLEQMENLIVNAVTAAK
ncbi:MAG: thioredoxin domain-containing protein [Chromatocurvus sp.]